MGHEMKKIFFFIWPASKRVRQPLPSSFMDDPKVARFSNNLIVENIRVRFRELPELHRDRLHLVVGPTEGPGVEEGHFVLAPVDRDVGDVRRQVVGLVEDVAEQLGREVPFEVDTRPKGPDLGLRHSLFCPLSLLFLFCPTKNLLLSFFQNLIEEVGNPVYDNLFLTNSIEIFRSIQIRSVMRNQKQNKTLIILKYI